MPTASRVLINRRPVSVQSEQIVDFDPYAKAITGNLNWKAPVFLIKSDTRRRPCRTDEDDAWGMPKCLVVDPSFDWKGDRAPQIPWCKTIVYQVNVKGFTARHPKLAPGLRGTYAGLASPQVINYLKNLGHHSGGIDACARILWMTSIWSTGGSGMIGVDNTTNFFAKRSLLRQG